MHNISRNFSDSHENYYTAYKYICNSDEFVLHSAEHPDIREIGSHKTKHFMKAYQRKHKLNKTTSSEEKQKQSKVRRLFNLDVCEFVVKNNIHTDIELFAKAKEEKEAAKKELQIFFFVSLKQILTKFVIDCMENGILNSNTGIFPN